MLCRRQRSRRGTAAGKLDWKSVADGTSCGPSAASVKLPGVAMSPSFLSAEQSSYHSVCNCAANSGQAYSKCAHNRGW